MGVHRGGSKDPTFLERACPVGKYGRGVGGVAEEVLAGRWDMGRQGSPARARSRRDERSARDAGCETWGSSRGGVGMRVLSIGGSGSYGPENSAGRGNANHWGVVG